MEPPAPRLRAELARLGYDVPAETAEAAIAAEISYYLDHHTEGGDPSSLAELRNRCAAVVREQLEIPGLSVESARAGLLAALHFEPYPDATPALATMRVGGLRLVVASNWDCSLRAVLGRAGIEPLVDDVITSADVGATKPDPAVFEAALKAAGRPAAETVHVGDSPENDVAGAHAAGLRAILLRRPSDPTAAATGKNASAGGSEERSHGDTPVISTLAELPGLLI